MVQGSKKSKKTALAVHLAGKPTTEHLSPKCQKHAKKRSVKDPCLPKKSPLAKVFKADVDQYNLDVNFPNGNKEMVTLVKYSTPYLVEQGTGASYYDDHNLKTAWCNGACRLLDIYDGMTVAHRSFPKGTFITMVSQDEKLPKGKVVPGIVGDRGPYMKGRKIEQRSIDPTKSVFHFFASDEDLPFDIFRKGLTIPIDIYINAYPLSDLIQCYCAKGDPSDLFCQSSEGNEWLEPPLPMTCSQPSEKDTPGRMEIVLNTAESKSDAYDYLKWLKKEIKGLPKGEVIWKKYFHPLSIVRKDGGSHNYWEIKKKYWNGSKGAQERFEKTILYWTQASIDK